MALLYPDRQEWSVWGMRTTNLGRMKDDAQWMLHAWPPLLIRRAYIKDYYYCYFAPGFIGHIITPGLSIVVIHQGAITAPSILPTTKDYFHGREGKLNCCWLIYDRPPARWIDLVHTGHKAVDRTRIDKRTGANDEQIAFSAENSCSQFFFPWATVYL